VKTLTTIVIALVVLAVPGVAAADCTKTSVSDLEDEVMCPVCGTSLALAREAPQAERQSAFIARLVERCHTKNEIKDALVTQFGDDVLALPADDGFNVTVYLAPLLAMLVAAAAIGFALVRWRRAGRPAHGPATASRAADALDEHDAARVEVELRREER
jgi:cytochrome c-type biogenesis protein CcmH